MYGFSTCAIDVVELSASRPGRYIPGYVTLIPNGENLDGLRIVLVAVE
jgi:hypothetical protein